MFRNSNLSQYFLQINVKKTVFGSSTDCSSILQSSLVETSSIPLDDGGVAA
jgi:hypothetical protein